MQTQELLEPFFSTLSLPQHLWYLWGALLKILCSKFSQWNGRISGLKITGLYSFDPESDTSISLGWFQRLCWNPSDLHPYEISIRPQCFHFSFVILGPSVLLPLLNTMFLKHQMCLCDEGMWQKNRLQRFTKQHMISFCSIVWILGFYTSITAFISTGLFLITIGKWSCKSFLA